MAFFQSAVGTLQTLVIALGAGLGEAKGFYHQEDKRIAIQDGMSEVQTIKTLLHEMAHRKLHDKDAVRQISFTRLTRSFKCYRQTGSRDLFR